MKVSIFLEHLVELAAQKRCSLAAALKEANRAGVGYVEIDYARTKGREADMVRLLNGTGLQPGGLYGFFDCAHQDESEALDAFVECAARLGVVNIMAMPGRMDEGWGWLIDRQFDIIQTDWPLQLRDYMARRKR